MSHISQIGLSPAPEKYKLDFVTRVYYMRIMGTLLCMLPIYSVLEERGLMTWWVVFLWLLNGVVWPHLAVRLARRSPDTSRQEFRNLTIDSFLGGIWIAVMGLAIVPTVVFLTVLAMDKVAAGGWRLFGRTQLALATGFGLAWSLLGFPFIPEASTRSLLLSVPLLFFYSIGLSFLMYRLGQQVVRQNKDLKRLSLMDPGLGVPNRRFFEVCAQHVLERVKLGRQTASLLLVDVDRFKAINDGYGHGVGDVVLQRLTAILADEVRESDLSARYGGDEFAVLLVDADLEQAKRIADRIRERVEAMMVEDADSLRCSVSIGVSQAKPEYSSLHDWVADADSVMYQAKYGGRNQISGN